MTLTNFIPTLWGAMLLKALETELHYAQSGIVNRDYEGEIKEKGDRVKINAIGDVSIKTYVKNTDLEDPEPLDANQQELIISEGHYFNFAIDDVERVQAKPDVMQEAMNRASYGLRNVADLYVANLMNSSIGASASNRVGTESVPKTDLGTAGKAYDYLVDLAVLLDNADTPTSGRFVVVPPFFHGQLLKDDRFVASGTAQAETRLMNGLIGEAAGLRVVKSNNTPRTSATNGYKIIAGHSIAVSYADQILQIEAFRPEKRFSDAVKGLHLYGAKVVRPSNLAILCANMP